MDDQALCSIDHLRDLPAQLALFGIGIRVGRQGTMLNDRDLAIIGRASQLQHFDRRPSRVTDAGLGTRRILTQLRTLDLAVPAFPAKA